MTGTVRVARVGAGGRILGMGTVHSESLATHLERVPGTVAVTQEEAAKFIHGVPLKLVNGEILPDEFTLEEAVARQVHSLRRECAKAITSGFSSAALAVPHRYPANATDQINLLAAAVAGVASPLWCADTAGIWAFREHAAAEVRMVLTDYRAAVLSHQARLSAALARVAAATKAADVLIVTW